METFDSSYLAVTPTAPSLHYPLSPQAEAGKRAGEGEATGGESAPRARRPSRAIQLSVGRPADRGSLGVPRALQINHCSPHNRRSGSMSLESTGVTEDRGDRRWGRRSTEERRTAGEAAATAAEAPRRLAVPPSLRPPVGAASARVKKRGSCASEGSAIGGHTFRDGCSGHCRSFHPSLHCSQISS